MKIASFLAVMHSFLKLCKTNRASGFTLVELMIVIGVMLTATAIAVPTYHLTIKPSADLKGASQRIFSDMQLARLRAVSENVDYGLAFSAGPTYQVFKDIDGDVQCDSGEEVKTVNLTDDYSTVQYDTSQGGGDGIDFSGGTVFTMTPRALPSVSGSVFLTNSKGEDREVSVNAMGGMAISQ